MAEAKIPPMRPVVVGACTALIGAWFLAGSAHADQVPLTSADRVACGAFSMTSALVHESIVPDPGPGGAPSRTYDLVGLANALNDEVNQPGVSADLHDDLSAYVYALAEVGAAINHHEPTDYSNLSKTRDKVADRCELWNMSRSNPPQ